MDIHFEGKKKTTYLTLKRILSLLVSLNQRQINPPTGILGEIKTLRFL